MENKTVLVGNVAAGLDTSDLDVMFSTVGNVEKISLTTDASSGRIKCLVEMSTPMEANDCVDRFHGQPLNGRPMSVSMDILRTYAPLNLVPAKKKRAARKAKAR